MGGRPPGGRTPPRDLSFPPPEGGRPRRTDALRQFDPRWLEGRHESPVRGGSGRCFAMTASSRRAVITGIGVVTPVGLDAGSFWRALAEGRTGIKPIRAFDTSGLPVRFAGEVADFDAREFVEKPQRKSLRVMARTIQLAVAAAQRALD